MLSWQHFPRENSIFVCIDFFLHTPPPPRSPSYPPMMIIVFKFLCRQVFECVDISWQSPVLMLLSLCLLILDILVFWVGSSALSSSFIFSQHHGARGTDAAWFLLLTEGDGYLLHISASKRELNSATYLLFLLFVSLPKIVMSLSVPALATDFSSFCLLAPSYVGKELQQ